MIDWLTLNCPVEALADLSVAVVYRKSRPHVLKINPSSGEVEKEFCVLDDEGEVIYAGALEWATTCYESIRSDSHQVTVRVGGDRISVFGSPARAMGLGHNVFGSSDMVECAIAMLAVAQTVLPFELPGLDRWFPSRTDVTHNYWLGGMAEVRQALVYLRQADGGRLKVNNKYAETVYWNETSDLNANKAYSKGAHLEYQRKKNQCEITDEEFRLSQGLLRLENRRGSRWWRRFRESGRDWRSLTECDLDSLHSAAFGAVIGTSQIEVTEVDSILESLKQVVDVKTGKVISESQALGAYRTWSMIKMVGAEEARLGMPPRTWRHHKKLLFAAGLSWADFAAGNIIPFRRKTIILGEPVRSWDDILKLQAA